MQDLIAIIMAKTGLEQAHAEKATGVLLNLVRTQGDKVKVDELFTKLPGAMELAITHGDRLTNSMAGGMMGGPLAAMAKLQSVGIDMGMVKVVASEILDFAKAKAGDQLVRQAAGNIPGLSGFL